METQHKKLYRSQTHRIIAGVCGGLAEYFQTDPTLVRIIFIFLCLLSGGGLIIYLILWIMIPEKHEHEHDKSAHEKFADEVNHHMSRSHNHTHGIIGFFLILVGILLLADNLFPEFQFTKFWPLLLILFGVAIMARHHDHRS